MCTGTVTGLGFVFSFASENFGLCRWLQRVQCWGQIKCFSTAWNLSAILISQLLDEYLSLAGLAELSVRFEN